MRIKLTYLLILITLGLHAQTVVEPPTRECPSAFAIVVDSVTYAHTRPSLMRYRDAVEADGLSTYIVSGNWTTPDEVKHAIVDVYRQRPTLEGIVLVGDIPVALIRNAQHLTTAFKMNESTFPFPQSSVPSDRFYDDLHLTFDFIRQDSLNPRHFYYKLNEDGPQALQPTFYSARITYPEAWGNDRYEAIAAFLDKAARCKREMSDNQLDVVVSFNGGSYNSDCLAAWMDEEKAYRENFPLAFRHAAGFKHLNFRMNESMKTFLINELQRKEIDVFMFHEHGLPTKQVINNEPVGNSFHSRHKLMKRTLYHELRTALDKGADKDSLLRAYTAEYHLTHHFFRELYDTIYWQNDSIQNADLYIAPADLRGVDTYPTFVMFDACYNGSFHEPDYLAAYYLFNDGRTVAVQGNTRNVLQDRWTIELIGLLSHGVRLGQWNNLTTTLEGHLMGDPTVRFAPIDTDLASTLSMSLHSKDPSYWETLLTSPYADVQGLALRLLADTDKLDSNELLQIFRETPLNTVRMEALKLLSRYRNTDFMTAVNEGIRDSYELVARQSAVYAAKIGDTSLLATYIQACIEDTERIRANYLLSNGLTLFPQTAVEQALEDYFTTTDRMDVEDEKEAVRQSIAKQFERVAGINQRIADESLTPERRIAAIRLLRNNPYHPHIDTYLQVLQRSDTPTEVRVALAEALGWFTLSVRRTDIIDTCRQMLGQEQPETLAAELKQTINRLN